MQQWQLQTYLQQALAEWTVVWAEARGVFCHDTCDVALSQQSARRVEVILRHPTATLEGTVKADSACIVVLRGSSCAEVSARLLRHTVCLHCFACSGNVNASTCPGKQQRGASQPPGGGMQRPPSATSVTETRALKYETLQLVVYVPRQRVAGIHPRTLVATCRCFRSSAGQSVRLLTARSAVRSRSGAF